MQGSISPSLPRFQPKLSNNERLALQSPHMHTVHTRKQRWHAPRPANLGNYIKPSCYRTCSRLTYAHTVESLRLFLLVPLNTGRGSHSPAAVNAFPATKHPAAHKHTDARALLYCTSYPPIQQSWLRPTARVPHTPTQASRLSTGHCTNYVPSPFLRHCTYVCTLSH